MLNAITHWQETVQDTKRKPQPAAADAAPAKASGANRPEWLKSKAKAEEKSPAPAAIDWDAFVDESIRQDAADRKSATARPGTTPPPYASSKKVRIGYFEAIYRAARLCILFALVSSVVVIGGFIFAVVVLRLPNDGGNSPVVASTAASRLVSPAPFPHRTQSKSPRVWEPLPAPSNRDPSNPPGPGYVWVRGSTDKNGVHRDGHWRKKPK